MNIAECLNVMKNIQTDFLEFIEDIENFEKKFINLQNKFKNMKIWNNKHDFRLILRFILSLCDNYHRDSTFIGKIEQILLFFKDEIRKCYTNSEIFKIFMNNKRIHLFLIKKGIIIVDESFAKQIMTELFTSEKYLQYFAPEIKPFMNEKWFLENNDLIEELKKELPDNFIELRIKGENDNYLCNLIFYVNKNSLTLNETIIPSIFETYLFLLEMHRLSEKGITLIEYAAFFGSIQIFHLFEKQWRKINAKIVALCNS